MQRIFTTLSFVILFGYAQAQNLLQNSGFESFTAGTSSYMTTGNGSLLPSFNGQWQLAFVGNNFPTCSGASCGTTQIDNTTQNSGSNSLYINITQQTNRNDIRLFQTIATGPTANNCVVTLWMRGDGAYPVTVNVFKSTEGITSNGACTAASPCQSFTIDTRWRMYKMYVDLSTWTTAERNNMRISIRPNTTTALPAGPYPKKFWFDDITFRPVDTLTELKEVAIQVATNRRYLAQDSGFTAEANSLQTEIATLTNATLTYPLTPVRAVGFFPVPTQTTAANNPFIAALNTWAATYLSQTFTEFPKSKAGSFVFPNSYDGRTLADVAMNLHWLLVSPYSNYRYNPELFRRFLTIVYATSDDYLLNGTEASTIPGNTVNALNDWFAAPETCDSWRVADTCFASYIPNTLLQKMRNAADLLGSQFYNYSLTAIPAFLYTNRDISYAEALINAGVYRNNNTWINYGKRIVDSMNLSTRLPDGAYLYRKAQNEVTNYHGGTTNSLAKIWVLSGYQPAWDCISRTANFEIMTIEPNEVPEFHTPPAWKTMYNGSSGASSEVLLAITQNPYLKTKYNQFRTIDGFNDEMPLSMAFYNPNISASPLPDNYVVYDRNIKGPRGRYGRFSYAGVGRSVALSGQNEPGLQTVVGAMETIPSNHGGVQDEMDAALMCVHSKVHVRNSSTPQEWTDWGYMMANVNVKSCVGRTASTISTPGVLQYQTSGPGAVETNWSSYQQWITLPDRLIGFVETYPTNNVNTQAFEIDGRVRFTYGRQVSNLSNPKWMITEVAGSRYAYGKFKTIIHAHDFTSVSVDTAGVVRDDFRNSMEIIFRYNLSNGTTLYSYPGSTKRYFMVEIRDSNAVGNATVSRVINGNVKGLVVKLNGKSYASYRNDGAAASVDLTNVVISGNTNQVLFSRGDSIINRPITITGTSYTVPANEQVLIISTNTPASDTGRGWMNYTELLNFNGNFPLPTRLLNFAGTQKGNSIMLQWQATSEVNLNRYEVEKSVDGISFVKAATAPAKCLANQSCTYDASVLQLDDMAYYRLKMIDNDGSYAYSKTVQITNVLSGKGQLVAYPNPLQLGKALQLQYNHTEVAQAATLSLFDAQGKLVQRKSIQLAKGNNLFETNTNQLSSGVYHVQLQVGNKTHQTSVTIGQ